MLIDNSIFLTKEQASNLYNIGFKEPCLIYVDGKDDFKIHNPPHFFKNGIFFSIPTHQQLINWAFDNFGIWSYVYKTKGGEWSFYMDGQDIEDSYGNPKIATSKLTDYLIENCLRMVLSN